MIYIQRMPKILNTTTEMIDALGGAAGYARRHERLGLNRQQINMWRKRNRVPAAWKAIVIRDLFEIGYGVPKDFMLPKGRRFNNDNGDDNVDRSQ